MAPETSPTPGDSTPVARFAPVALIKPVLAGALGVDGGAIFQVLAVEDLELSSHALAIAFGLGLLSLPLQLWAGRLPFRLAVRNLQLFLVMAAAQSATLAWLVGTQARGLLASTALAVTITAEVAVSVLLVTAWQPLLALQASAIGRQHLNAGWSAAGKMILAGSLVVFASLSETGRVIFLAGLAVVCLVVASDLRRLKIRDAVPVNSGNGVCSAVWTTPHLRWILATLATINLGAAPLWLVYLARVMWPTAPLGVVGAVQTISTVAALVAWRATTKGLGRRVIGGVLTVLAGSMALGALGPAAETSAQQAVVVAATIAMSFGVAYSSLALLETVHRLVASQQEDTVRIFTLIDVVDSSSLQLGLFFGGLLIALPHHVVGTSTYFLFIASTNALAFFTALRTTRRAAECG